MSTPDPPASHVTPICAEDASVSQYNSATSIQPTIHMPTPNDSPMSMQLELPAKSTPTASYSSSHSSIHVQSIPPAYNLVQSSNIPSTNAIIMSIPTSISDEHSHCHPSPIQSTLSYPSTASQQCCQIVVLEEKIASLQSNFLHFKHKFNLITLPSVVISISKLRSVATAVGRTRGQLFSAPAVDFDRGCGQTGTWLRS